MSKEESTVSFGVLGKLKIPLALGLLRLTTEGRPAESQAIALIHAALDAGVRLLDTADVYCLDQKDLHYGEKLVCHALKTWQGPGQEVKVLTKAGMTRPQGKWVPHGKPEQLYKAVTGSLQALETEQLFVLQLHVHDPRVPFEETLACLAELQKTGKVLHVGLCNTTVAEIQQAQRHFRVAVVQNELSLTVRKSAQDGTLAYCQEQGIPFLAYRPFGGAVKVEKWATNKVLQPMAKKHFVTPAQIALAAVRCAGPHVVPLIGATRLSSLQLSMQALKIKLDTIDRSVLEAKYSFASKVVTVPSSLSAPALNVGEEGDSVVLIMGIQGAGKSELVNSYLEKGYTRLNRDILGGKLEDLVPKLQQLLANGQRKVVLDNTYPTRISRVPIVAVARAAGLPVICRFLETPIHEARINVVLRMLSRYNRPLGPEEMKSLAKTDPNLPPPAALKRWVESFEPPHLDEGFAQLEAVPFQRRREVEHTHKGLLLDVDGTLRITRSGEIYPRHPDDITLLPRRQQVLQRWVDDGYQLFFISNQSGIASGKVSQHAVEASFLRTAELLQLAVKEVSYCPHPAFPVGCYCRKPMPGLGVYLMQRHQLSHEHLVVVGDMESDAEFASSLGAKYFDAEEFFG